MSDGREQSGNGQNSASNKQDDMESTLSKSAKKRAKKNQKKAAEAAGAAGTSPTKEEREKKDSDVTDSKKATPVKSSARNASPEGIEHQPEGVHIKLSNNQAETSKKGNKEEEQSDKTLEGKSVPKIQRFDTNGRAIKTIAGKSSVHLGEITPHNVLQLKKLNEAVLPIRYNDKFYVEARSCGELGRLAYFNDVVAGAVCCRIDDISDEKSLYIMTLGTLAAYRQIGIGAVLIDYVHKLCEKHEEIKTVHLHVQVNNQSAVHFYEKHGFTNDDIIEDYYRIEPRDAYLLFKRIRS